MHSWLIVIANSSLATSFLIICVTVDYCTAALRKITQRNMLKELLEIPYEKVRSTISNSQGGKGFEDLFGQPQLKMEKVVGTIILGLIKQEDLMFNIFLQKLEKSKNNKWEKLAQKLREYINKY